MVESSGLLNRRRVVKLYRGFESPPSPPDQKAAKLNVSVAKKAIWKHSANIIFRSATTLALLALFFRLPRIARSVWG